MRIIEKILRAGHRRKRNAGPAARLERGLAGHPGKQGFNAGQQPGPLVDAVVVGFQARVRPQIGQSKHFAERSPVFITGDPDKDLPAAGADENAVDTPGAHPGRHRWDRAVGQRGVGHMMAHHEGGVFEQPALHELPFARRISLAQSQKHRHRAIRRAHDVDHGRARAQRLANRAGHVGQPAHHLHDFVERHAILVRTAQESFERAVDQTRVHGCKGSVSQPQAIHRPRREILNQGIRGSNQPIDDLPTFLGLEIDHHALLVAIEKGVVARAKALEPAGVITIRGLFDSDYLGAEIGQNEAAGGPHDGMGELQHAESA